MLKRFVYRTIGPLLFMCLLSLGDVAYAQSTLEHHILYAAQLSENRAISISLPEGYHSGNKDYPVLYLLDGEYIFSYARGAADFLTNDFGYLPEMIVVSIPNTDRHRDLFFNLQDNQNQERFISFLTTELMPFIQDHYRVNDFNILYGWSSGSGVCMYLLSHLPEYFDAYILTGTGIGPKTAEYIRSNIADAEFQNAYLYACVESDSPRTPALLRFQALMDTLQPAGLTQKFEVIPESSHVEVLAKGLDAGLKFVFADYYIPDDITLKGTSAILEYFQGLSNRYGFPVSIPEGAINESVSILFYHEQKEAAIQLLQHGLTLYPKSVTLHGTLGEIYQLTGNEELSKNHYEKARDNATGDMKNHLKFQTLLQGVRNKE